LSDTPELFIDPTILAPLTCRRLSRGQISYTAFPNGDAARSAGISNI
jgi:hypothetical protein